MSDPALSEPVEEWLADWLSARLSGGRPERVERLLRRLGHYDRLAYRKVARLETPLLDEPLRRTSDFANFSRPWLLAAAGLALLGGTRGRRAALTGLAAIAATSFVVNQPMKMAAARIRPDREFHGVPVGRWVPMPTSTSFPSGHSASAAAFAVSIGDVIPGLRLPLRSAAAVVAFSRVYTGVHYPSDVLVGASVGALIGRTLSIVTTRMPSDRSTAH